MFPAVLTKHKQKDFYQYWKSYTHSLRDMLWIESPGEIDMLLLFYIKRFFIRSKFLSIKSDWLKEKIVSVFIFILLIDYIDTRLFSILWRLSNYLTKTFDVHKNHMHLNHFCWWSVEKSLAMPHLLLLFWSNNPFHLE